MLTDKEYKDNTDKPVTIKAVNQPATKDKKHIFQFPLDIIKLKYPGR